MLPFPDWAQFVRRTTVNGDGFFQVSPRKIYILPTRYGFMFAALVISMLIGSINYANNLGYMLTFFLTGVGILAIYQTWLNLLDLRIQFLPVQAVFAGQQAQLQANIFNRYDRPRGLLELSVRNHPIACLESIDADAKKTFTLNIPVEKRGWFPVKQLVIASQYPLGLFRAWSYIESDIQILVYAKPSSFWQPPKTLTYAHNTEGNKGVGADDFVSHRNYRQSDSPRQIDWKIFAREKGLMTKQFGGDRDEQMILSLDLVDQVSLEKGLSKLTRAVLDAEKNHLAYGLELPGVSLPISHGDDHLLACLKHLALFGLE